jgi:phosphoenolpyruvate synthase/pyruvate phosphate dikinase
MFGRSARSWWKEVDGLFTEILTLIMKQIQDATTALVTRQTNPDIESVMRRRQQQIYETIEEIRSRLIVHAAVRGAEVDLPLLLSLMSVTKDADAISHLTDEVLRCQTWRSTATGVLGRISNRRAMKWRTSSPTCQQS